jgi:hypothetical protein
MSAETSYHTPDADVLASILVGRRVVNAEMNEGAFTAVRHTRWGDQHERYDGRLTLDDGTHLLVRGNTGGCICGAGDYSLSTLGTIDNVITRVEVDAQPGGNAGRGPLDDGYTGWYRIFVFAENEKVNLAQFTGSDGNGWYGTGFEIEVVRE